MTLEQYGKQVTADRFTTQQHNGIMGSC